ncbi:MAG TPA: proprotein convertase P-domain-containing protein [Planctomycetota bacterium]|jgi:subtilisin-like proprotein convertase family protein|nr:proprotein convertase P-domain-containing protein [Planctomycetota bacterium]
MRDSQLAVLGGVVLALAGGTARAQVDPAASPAVEPPSRAIPEGYVTAGALHRVVAKPGDALIGALRAAGAVAQEIDYGSFVLLLVDARPLGGIGALQATGATIRDEWALIELNGFLLDTAHPAALAATLATVPPALTQSEELAAVLPSLRIVQFVGPIRDEWLDALRATGARPVSYVPNDAYVVSVDPLSLSRLAAFAGERFVQWTGPYHPAFRIRPDLRPTALEPVSVSNVVVQVIEDRHTVPFLLLLATQAVEPVGPPDSAAGFLDLPLSVPDGLIALLAAHPSVFAVEPKDFPQKFDERQGVISAGQLNGTGTGPASPTFLSWLASKGFQQAGQFGFVVDVHDDGVDRGSASDVNVEFRVGGTSGGASRLSYNFNYTSDPVADSGAGHGNINASIVGGYNGLAGTAFEDPGGYQYGLGLAPFVNLGNSKVFANSGAGQFNQATSSRMASAYNAGARISSNSWGYTTGNNYNSDTQVHDARVRDAVTGTAGNQELTIVFANGNSGPTAGSVHPPGTGKNVLSVGASENDRQTGTDGCGVGNTGANDARDIISFSSRGPCSDGRKKPEIVAPGTHIQGAASRSLNYDGSGVCNAFFPAGQTLYCWSSGTSHSTPGVSGGAALVRQYFLNQGWGTPSPAMTKAFLANSAVRLTGVGANDTLPSNNQGMGRMDLGRAFDGVARVRVDQAQVLGASGATFTTSGTIASSAEPFRVSLAWTDAPGPTTGNAFVNNLDLEVTVNGTLYRGNVFSGGNSISGGTADGANNLESVFLPAGTTGSFSVTVKATNVAGDGVPGNADATDQDFALLVYNGTTAAPTPDFSLSASPTSRTITVGGSTTYAVTSTPSGGFASNVSLSASPAIAGVTYAFSPNPVAANGSSTLTVSTTAAATTGTHTITITGTGGGLTRTTTATLILDPAATPNFALSVSPASRTITVGGSTTYTVTSTPSGGFASNVTLSASPAIAGVSASFVPNPVAASGSSTLTVSTTAGATTGTHTITITGTGGGLTRTTGASLTLNPPASGIQVLTFLAAPNLSIPDNNATGVTSTISVPSSQTISSVAVTVAVTHTWIGDLRLTLISPAGTQVILHNNTGGSADNINTTYAIVTTPSQSLALNGQSTLGSWQLKAQDLAAADVGTLNSWKITFNGEKKASPALSIPDNNATGVTSALNYAETGTVASVKVRVNITHTWIGDLRVTLISPAGTQVILHNNAGGSADNIVTEYPDLTVPAQSLSAFNGQGIAGNWQLKVQDLAAADVGTLNSWTLSLTAP